MLHCLDVLFTYPVHTISNEHICSPFHKKYYFFTEYSIYQALYQLYAWMVWMFNAQFTNSFAVISWQSVYKWRKPNFTDISSCTGERLSVKLHRKQIASFEIELRTLTLIGIGCKVRYEFNGHISTTWVCSYGRCIYLYQYNQYP